MKKIFSIAILLMLVSKGFSQYNLQFNKVLTYTGTFNFTTNNSAIWTVPQNKVWKIESMTTNQQFIGNTAAQMFFKLNEVVIKQYFVAQNTVYYQMIETPTPLWLKAEDFIQFTSNTNLAGNYNCNYFISIVEFNLTPQ